MGHVTITIAEIKRPSDGRDRGNIIGTDGTKLGCFREKFGLFQVGQTYEIEVSDGQYANVKSAKQATANAPAATFTSGAYRPPATTQAASNGTGGYYRPTSPEDAERMFVCATLGALIKAGEVKNDKGQLFHATKMLRGLWQHTFGNGGTFEASQAGRPRMVAAE